MLWGIFVAQHCNSSKWIETWDFNSVVILWYIFDIKHVQSARYICLNCNFVCYLNCQMFLFKLPNLFNQIAKWICSNCKSWIGMWKFKIVSSGCVRLLIVIIEQGKTQVVNTAPLQPNQTCRPERPNNDFITTLA